MQSPTYQRDVRDSLEFNPFSKYSNDLYLFNSGQVSRHVPSVGYHVYCGGAEIGERFHRAIKTAMQLHKYGAAVEVKSAAEYSNRKYTLILADDDSAGAVVTPEQDLGSVHRRPGASTEIRPILDEAVRLGALTLDCFDIREFLPRLYAAHGFRPVRRIKFLRAHAPTGWDYSKAGEPNVVFMIHDPMGITGLPDVDQLQTHVPFARDFDEAVAVRQKYVAAIRKWNQMTLAGPGAFQRN